MSFIITATLILFSFFLGRLSAKLEYMITFRDQLVVIIQAIIKVDELLSFAGKSIKDLSVAEVIEKVTNHLDLKKGN